MTIDTCGDTMLSLVDTINMENGSPLRGKGSSKSRRNIVNTGSQPTNNAEDAQRTVVAVQKDDVGKKKEKELSFGMVEVYEFPMILGDHPDVSCGCPVTIGWKCQAYLEFPATKYNNAASNKPTLSAKRKLFEFKLSPKQRIHM